MDITPVLTENALSITAYGAGEIKINADSYNHAIILHPERVEKWNKPAIDETIIDQLSSCEVILIGCGEQAEFVPPKLREQIKAATGAGVEVMDTGAACRTYNVLLAEGRRVIALLMPI